MKIDRDYLQRRAAQERQAAEQAATEEARQAHLELAEAYEKILEAEDSAPKPALP